MIVDLAERTGWTFVQAFTAALTLGALTDLESLKLAGIAGGYAVIKFLGVKANEYLNKPPATTVNVVLPPAEDTPAK